MAKSDLIGGTLWESYSRKVNDRMLNPRHLGEITAADAEKLGARLVVADWGAEVCGDAIRAFWAVDPATNRIKDARFKTFGCGTAIASSDMMCEMIIGKTVDEAMKITNIDVEASLRESERQVGPNADRDAERAPPRYGNRRSNGDEVGVLAALQRPSASLEIGGAVGRRQYRDVVTALSQGRGDSGHVLIHGMMLRPGKRRDEADAHSYRLRV